MNKQGQTQEPVGEMKTKEEILKKHLAKSNYSHPLLPHELKLAYEAMEEYAKLDIEALAKDKYPERFEQCNGTLGMYGLCDVNYYNREAFKAGYSSYLPVTGESEAIGFAEWISNNQVDKIGFDMWRFNFNTTHTTKQLYKLYKNGSTEDIPK